MPERPVRPAGSISSRGSLSTARLLRARALTRSGLLASVAATIAIAVATIVTLLAVLARAVATAGDPPPPGMSAETLADEVATGTAALLSAAPAPVLLVVILAGTATTQLGRLLASAREHEMTALRARGLSKGQAVRSDVPEAAVVAGAGGAVGLAVAAGVLWIVRGTEMMSGAEIAGAPPEAIAVGVGAGVVLSAALGAIFVASTRAPSRSSRRGARATTATLVVLVAAAAVFAVWQLRFARPEGFDPVVAAAPAVVLLAAALLALAGFGALVVAWAGFAATRRGLAPSFPARQVARRVPIAAVAVLLVALTMAQAVFASAYASTSTRLATDVAAQQAGADLRVDLSPSVVTAEHVASVAEVDGVEAAAPALVNPIEIGESDADLVAVPAGEIDTVVAASPAERAALEAAVASDGVESASLGESATGLRVGIRVAAPDGVGAVPQLVASVVDAHGTLEAVRLVRPWDPVFSDTMELEFEAEGPLPAGAAPWSLVAVTAALPAAFGQPTIVVRLESAEAIGGESLDVSGEVTLTRDIPEAHVWLGAPEADIAEPPPVPVAVSAALAERLGLDVGDDVGFRYAGTGRSGVLRVAEVVSAVPGAAAPLAAFADLGLLQLSMLERGTSVVAAGSVWASGDPAAAADVSAVLHDRPVATAAPGVAASIVGALAPAWWVSASGSVVLSLVAAFAIVQTLAGARRRELGVLRALGVSGGRQARMRGAELSGVFGLAVVLGGLTGALAAWFAVPALVAAVTPGIPSSDAFASSASVSFALWPLAFAAAVLVAGLAVVVTLAMAGVSRAARTATAGEEAR